MEEIEESSPSGVAVIRGVIVSSPSWEEPWQEAASQISSLMGKKKHGVS